MGSLPEQPHPLRIDGASECDAVIPFTCVDPEDLSPSWTAPGSPFDACDVAQEGVTAPVLLCEVQPAPGHSRFPGCIDDPHCAAWPTSDPCTALSVPNGCGIDTTTTPPHLTLTWSPPGRFSAGAIWDPVAAELVFFGGTSGCTAAACNDDDGFPFAAGLALPNPAQSDDSLGMLVRPSALTWSPTGVTSIVSAPFELLAAAGLSLARSGYTWRPSTGTWQRDPAGPDTYVVSGGSLRDLPASTWQRRLPLVPGPPGYVGLEIWNTPSIEHDPIDEQLHPTQATWTTGVPPDSTRLLLAPPSTLVPTAQTVASTDGDQGGIWTGTALVALDSNRLLSIGGGMNSVLWQVRDIALLPTPSYEIGAALPYGAARATAVVDPIGRNTWVLGGHSGPETQVIDHGAALRDVNVLLQPFHEVPVDPCTTQPTEPRHTTEATVSFDYTNSMLQITGSMDVIVACQQDDGCVLGQLDLRLGRFHDATPAPQAPVGAFQAVIEAYVPSGSPPTLPTSPTKTFTLNATDVRRLTKAESAGGTALGGSLDLSQELAIRYTVPADAPLLPQGTRLSVTVSYELPMAALQAGQLHPGTPGSLVGSANDMRTRAREGRAHTRRLDSNAAPGAPASDCWNAPAADCAYYLPAAPLLIRGRTELPSGEVVDLRDAPVDVTLQVAGAASGWQLVGQGGSDATTADTRTFTTDDALSASFVTGPGISQVATFWVDREGQCLPSDGGRIAIYGGLDVVSPADPGRSNELTKLLNDGVLQADLDHAVARFGPIPHDRDVLLSHDPASGITSSTSGTRSAAWNAHNLIEFVAYDDDGYELRPLRYTLSHELVHSWFGDRHPDMWVPRWVREGVAQLHAVDVATVVRPRELMHAEVFETVYQLSAEELLGTVRPECRPTRADFDNRPSDAYTQALYTWRSLQALARAQSVDLWATLSQALVTPPASTAMSCTPAPCTGESLEVHQAWLSFLDSQVPGSTTSLLPAPFDGCIRTPELTVVSVVSGPGATVELTLRQQQAMPKASKTPFALACTPRATWPALSTSYSPDCTATWVAAPTLPGGTMPWAHPALDAPSWQLMDLSATTAFDSDGDGDNDSQTFQLTFDPAQLVDGSGNPVPLFPLTLGLLQLPGIGPGTLATAYERTTWCGAAPDADCISDIDQDGAPDATDCVEDPTAPTPSPLLPADYVPGQPLTASDLADVDCNCIADGAWVSEHALLHPQCITALTQTWTAP